MRSRLFKKFFFTTSFIILFSITAMMVILTFVYNDYLLSNTYKSLKKTCQTVSDYSETVIEYGKQPTGVDVSRSIYFTAKSLADVSDYDVFITDKNGRIMICICDEWGQKGTCIHCDSKISDKFIKKANGGDVAELNNLGIYGKPQYAGASAIYNGDERIGYVIASAPMSASYKLIQTVIKYYIISAAIPIIVMFFAIYAITYRLTKPMKQMSEAAYAMARGDFSRRIPVKSDDEIGQLAVSFNQMTNALAQLEGMRRSFVANVSHELKTPMTTIGGFIDGMLDGTIEPEKQSYYLNIVSGEVKRLSRIVETMLHLAKLESGEFVLKYEEFNFRELLIDVVLSQEQRIEQKSININGLEETQQVTLNADKDLLHQAIYNLVDNAVKFTPEGGSIDFALTSDRHSLLFRITNTGKGIPKESLPFIFERFYKVDKSRSANKTGTGLGLYIVKTIVKNHGGHINATSRENETTTFEIVLPLIK